MSVCVYVWTCTCKGVCVGVCVKVCVCVCVCVCVRAEVCCRLLLLWHIDELVHLYTGGIVTPNKGGISVQNETFAHQC